MQRLAVTPNFFIHLARIESVDAGMREGVATDFMAAIVKRADLRAIDDAPVPVQFAEDSGGDVECPVDAVLFEDCGAVGIGRRRNVVESEAHKRHAVAHCKWLGARMPRRLTQNA